MGLPWRAGAWLLVLALLAAQAIALVHGVVHGGHTRAAPDAQALVHALSNRLSSHDLSSHGLAGAHAHAPAAAHTHEHPDHNHPEAHGLIERLFGTHHDDLDCRLYDQLGHADATLSLPAAVLPLALPAAVFDFLSGAFVARRAALFEARAPPPVR